MDYKTRAKIVEDSYKRRTDLMVNKGGEYSRGEEDVNSNFKRVAEAIGLKPSEVCYVYMAKHWDSVSSYIKTRKQGTEGIIGRLDDLRNYIDIIESILVEEGVKEDK